MTELKLTAKNSREQTVLENLIPMLSETLIEKINNGVYIEKGGKRLLNLKDLSTFMEYAEKKARETLAENQRKGTQAVCVHGDDIMSWAIHYFEEDTIEGKLYTEDGTEFKPVVKPIKEPVTVVLPPKPAPKPQMSIFDIMTGENDKNGDNSGILPPQPQNAPKTTETTEKVIAPVICADKPKKQPIPLYQTYLKLAERYEGFLILLKLGDFYEAMNDHATTLASELNLTLTSRDVGLDERVPIVGIPYHAVDNYVNKLLDRGYKVILAEDLENVLKFENIDDYDETEEVEEMSVNEMRQFDSYVDDSDELPTVSKLIGDTPIEDDGESCDEILNAESAKAFDKEALCILSDLFDGEITLA